RGGRPGRQPGQLVPPAFSGHRPLRNFLRGIPVTGDASAAGVRTGLQPVAVNLLGVIEHPSLDGGPWRIGRNGTPYVPLGDGGFGQADLARMRPSDQVAVRGCGQGMRPPALRPDVMVMNTDPDVLALLPVTAPGGDAPVTAGVRMTVPSRLAGNGIGRPAAGW